MIDRIIKRIVDRDARQTGYRCVVALVLSLTVVGAAIVGMPVAGGLGDDVGTESNETVDDEVSVEDDTELDEDDNETTDDLTNDSETIDDENTSNQSITDENETNTTTDDTDAESVDDDAVNETDTDTDDSIDEAANETDAVTETDDNETDQTITNATEASNESVNETVENETNETVDTSSDDVDADVNKTEETVESTANQTDEAITDTTDSVNETEDAVEIDADESVNETTGAIDETTNDTTAAVDSVDNETSGTVNESVNTVDGAVNESTGTITESVNETEDTVDTIANASNETLNETAGTADETLNETTDSFDAIANKSPETVNESTGVVDETVTESTETIDSIQQETETANNDTTAAVLEVIHEASTTVDETLITTTNELENGTIESTNTSDALDDTDETVLEAPSGTVGELVEATSDDILEDETTLVGSSTESIEDTEETVTNSLSAVVSAIADGVEPVVSTSESDRESIDLDSDDEITSHLVTDADGQFHSDLHDGSDQLGETHAPTDALDVDVTESHDSGVDDDHTAFVSAVTGTTDSSDRMSASDPDLTSDDIRHFEEHATNQFAGDRTANAVNGEEVMSPPLDDDRSSPAEDDADGPVLALAPIRLREAGVLFGIGVATMTAGVAGQAMAAKGGSTGGLLLARYFPSLPWSLTNWLPRFPIIPGYSRYDDSDPLAHDLRQSMHETVTDRPGIHLSALAETLDSSRSNVRYHARVLERERLVECEKVRGRRRLFPLDDSDQQLAAVQADQAASRLLTAIDQLEPVTVSSLAEAVDRDDSTVSYHLDKLADDGLIEREDDGAAVNIRLAPTARAELTPSASSPTARAESTD